MNISSSISAHLTSNRPFILYTVKFHLLLQIDIQFSLERTELLFQGGGA